MAPGWPLDSPNAYLEVFGQRVNVNGMGSVICGIHSLTVPVDRVLFHVISRYLRVLRNTSGSFGQGHLVKS